MKSWRENSKTRRRRMNEILEGAWSTREGKSSGEEASGELRKRVEPEKDWSYVYPRRLAYFSVRDISVNQRRGSYLIHLWISCCSFKTCTLWVSEFLAFLFSFPSCVPNGFVQCGLHEHLNNLKGLKPTLLIGIALVFSRINTDGFLDITKRINVTFW